jgi:hypothetical protein
MQHYPASARIIRLNATTASKEGLARKQSAGEQHLQYDIPPQYLDALWNRMLEIIDTNPAYERFQGATLFLNSKNTKLQFMDPTGNLNAAYEKWEHQWSLATDPQFYNRDHTFVDLAKQITSPDHALPYDQIPDNHEAEVYLWRKCCMDAYATTRIQRNADGSPAKGNPKCTRYRWATMRDAMSQTFFTARQGQECQDGLIYTQFYNLIKAPFDTAKRFVFNNDALENLALDPGYIRSLQQEGGAATFSKSVCEFGYLHGKHRAHANLLDNRWKSYGIREEHRISLGMMAQIARQWRQWDLYDDDADLEPAHLPYFIIPTQDLLGFLYAQINKYCFLFEHVLAHTARTYSLPETLVMVTALRALRFCYNSNLIQRESLLYKDRWEVLRHGRVLVKEGVGIQVTIERCGIGWFLPKFNWATWRFTSPHGENILVGNVLMHAEYKRRWRAVKDLRDVYVRFNQAESWYTQYHIEQHPALLEKWLEYLHALNLEQFDVDLIKAMLKCNKHSPELTPGLVDERGDLRFCRRGMKAMFTIDGCVGPPHFVTGNKMRFDRVVDLLDFLFLWDDDQERRGWGNKAYRVIVQKSFELIERRLGLRRANQWLDELFHLVRLTHWVLPYPSHTAFIASTKTSRSQGLRGRMMWFSVVYADPTKVDLPFRTHPTTLYQIFWKARQQVFGDDRDPPLWSTAQLITAGRNQGIKILGHETTDEFWMAGKRSIGVKGFVPVWERSLPPRLEMMEQIKNKSLDELELVMSHLSRDYSNVAMPDLIAAGDARSENEAAISNRSLDHDRPTRSVRTSVGRGIMAAFGRHTREDFEHDSEDMERSSWSMSSGSLFVPSV